MGNFKVSINGINTNDLRVLTKEETNELFNRYHNGDMAAKEELINGNLKLVLSIIKKYNNGKNDMNDLFQVGCIGLIKAIDNFDSSLNLMLSTYAVPLIIGEVKRHLRDSTNLRITRSIRDLAYNIMKFKDKYFEENGKEPTNDEIIEALNITEFELREAYDSCVEPASIYDPIYNDGGDTIYLLDQIADKNIDKTRDDLIALRRALKQIKSRERDILVNRYIVGKTQMELASELGVSQAQISRIEKSAIKNVKKLIK